MGDPAARYLELLKSCLTRDLFPEQNMVDAIYWAPDDLLGEPAAVWELLRERGWRLVRPVSPEPTGVWFQPNAETMVSRARLDNVQMAVESVLGDEVPGDLVETGVWRGGTAIFMRALLAVHASKDRIVWACDSFEGLPKPDPTAYPHDAQMVISDADTAAMVDLALAVSVEEVMENFRRYDLLDDQVRFVEGWFSESLPSAPIDQIAVLRLDGDLYESTRDALIALEPKVSPGGYVIVDDYGALEPCRAAVTEYREQHGIHDPIEEVDWTGAFWRKTGR